MKFSLLQIETSAAAKAEPAGALAKAQGGKETPLEPSFVQRVAQGVRYAVSGVTPATWFGPAQPITPQAPEEVKGRQFDYLVGVNLRLSPRQEEAVSFAQMRGLADGYDLLRLVIETRKDQLAKFRWTIKAREGRTVPPARLAALTDFFRSPDKEHDWDEWLRALLEDMLVLDAATLYPRRTRGGGLYAFELMDGATIKRVLDASGRTPQPPDPAYQQILHGLPASDYSRAELIYRPRNVRTHKVYGYSPVEQIIMTVNIAIRRQLHQLQFYTEGNVPEMLFGVPETWNVDQVAQFQAYWDLLLAGDTAARRHAKFVPGGLKPMLTKEAALKDDYDEWLARVVCYAFSVPPTAFVKMVNRASGETMQEAALEEGLIPLQLWIKSTVDCCLHTHMAEPDAEFAWNIEQEPDQLKQATVDQIYVTSGIRDVDEVRDDRGWGPKASTPTPDAHDAPPALPAGETVAKAEKGRKALAPIPFHRPLVAHETSKLAAAIARVFKQQAAFLAKAAAPLATAARAAKAEGDPIQRILDDLEALGFSISLIDPSEAALRRVMQDTGAKVLTQVGVQNNKEIVNLVHEDAVDFARARAAEMVGRTWVKDKLVANPNAAQQIDEQMRNSLRELITTALEQGPDPKALAKQISEATAFSPERAERIARTELARAHGEGALTGYRAAKASGVPLKKSWSTAGSGDCEICAANEDAGDIELEEDFPSGDSTTPAHPNCECAVIPVVVDTHEEEET